MTTVDLILPVLDEAAALPWVLGRVTPGVRPIVVDNGSADGSASVARRLGAMVVEEPFRGFGSACAAGLRAATAEVVVFCDADASLDPAELPRVLAPVVDRRADLVLGKREAASWKAWPPHARMANAVLAWRLRSRIDVALTDLGPMRAVRRRDLLELDLGDRRFGWPLEMVLRAASAGLRIEEVPVSYRPRVGRSKVTGTVAGTVRTIRDMRRILNEVPARGTRASP
jgi:glycosyltransferase involved in cell wall biosynthesis